MPSRALVLDANILVRAVLGKRVRAVIGAHAESASFFVPEASYTEAEEHLATLVAQCGGDAEKALSLLRSLRSLTVPIGSDVYGEFETEARRRLATRDPEDMAGSGLCVGAWLPNLDRRHGFFRVWCGHLDVGPCSDVSARVIVLGEWPRQTVRSKITWNAKAPNLISSELVRLHTT